MGQFKDFKRETIRKTPQMADGSTTMKIKVDVFFESLERAYDRGGVDMKAFLKELEKASAPSSPFGSIFDSMFKGGRR